jgi:hypothetical protein
MPSIDFAAVKAAVSIEDAKDYLGLKMKREGDAFRSPCPTCGKGGDRALVITPARSAFYCFSVKRGGDCIALVAHIKGCSQREAATELQERFIGNAPKRIETRPTETDELQPLDHLSADHPAIDALGLSVAACEALGIGYAAKGMMRGRVAFPLRLPDGTLVGYAGLATSGDQAPLMLLPSNLDERIAAPPKQEIADDKVVDFKKFYRNAS